MRVFFWITLIWSQAMAWAAPALPQSRIDRLERTLLAPCCYEEPISRHQSEIATKMRLEVARLVEAGRTDQEILDAYVRLYGAKILTNPDQTPAGWSYLVPILALLAGLCGVAAMLMQWRAVTMSGSSGQELSDLELPAGWMDEDEDPMRGNPPRK
jgi:cytochrome c-type biogenesis protein CcmH/NrfF